MPTKPPTHRADLRQYVETHRPQPRSASAMGYGYHWRKLRDLVLARQPLCVDCLARGRVEAATQVDHIVPRRAGGTDDDHNLQALCARCHSRKTATVDRKL